MDLCFIIGSCIFFIYFSDEKDKDEGQPDEEEGDGEDIAEIEPSIVTESENAIPILTSDQYSSYVNSIIKVIVGERTYTDWLQKGKNHPRLWLA